MEDKIHRHFWIYTGGSWATENETLFGFRCVSCNEKREYLSHAGNEYQELVELNWYWYKIDPQEEKCPKEKMFGHSWWTTKNNKDLKCQYCKKKIKNYEEVPKEILERCIESNSETTREYGMTSVSYFQCIMAKNHVFNHKFKRRNL